ncbi:MAG: hypothetical protein Q8P93_00795 [bacterium]|nr:hypothetical protein [bacterium]
MEQELVTINLEYIFQKIYELLFGVGDTAGAGVAAASFVYIVSYIASAVLFGIIVYYLYEIHGLKKRDELDFVSLFKIKPESARQNERWADIVSHITSDNPAQWRVAILEADSMLEEMLRTIGYTGVGVGEMLKQIDRGTMVHLNAAWEAHKVRNKIAHEGSNYGLTEAEAHQTINLYRLVFEEFGLI